MTPNTCPIPFRIGCVIRFLKKYPPGEDGNQKPGRGMMGPLAECMRSLNQATERLKSPWSGPLRRSICAFYVLPEQQTGSSNGDPSFWDFQRASLRRGMFNRQQPPRQPSDPLDVRLLSESSKTLQGKSSRVRAGKFRPSIQHARLFPSKVQDLPQSQY
jgi:hypothetical protein